LELDFKTINFDMIGLSDQDDERSLILSYFLELVNQVYDVCWQEDVFFDWLFREDTSQDIIAELAKEHMGMDIKSWNMTDSTMGRGLRFAKEDYMTIKLSVS
jgi:hypothetical protein